MSRIILIFGIVAGVVVAVPMCLMAANSEHGSAAQSFSRVTWSWCSRSA